MAALALTGTRTGLVVTLHNAATAGGAIGAIYGLLERIVARRADRILVVSPDLGERMTALGARLPAAALTVKSTRPTAVRPLKSVTRARTVCRPAVKVLPIPVPP